MSLISSRFVISTKKLTELALTSKVVQRWPAMQAKRFLSDATAKYGQVPKDKRMIGYWLLGCAGVSAIGVFLGGLTRLTESGLAIPTWGIIGNLRPPMSDAEWQHEYERYKTHPDHEYQSHVDEMTLDRFKHKYNIQFIHRMWGQMGGLAFLGPAIYFWTKGRFNSSMKTRVMIMGALLSMQPFIGWWMVKSGIDRRIDPKNEIPRVSQYRLTAHLTNAYIMYSLFLWNGLSYLLKPFDHGNVAGINTLRGLTMVTKSAIFTTAVLAGFVAGLNAGLVYNTWPKFNSNWIPDEIMTKSPWWRNLFENQVTVQFIHRHLAYFSVASTTATWLVGRRLNLSPRARLALNSLFAMALTQAAVGIITLINLDPKWLASIHQNGGVALMSLALWFAHEIRRVPK